MVSNGVSGFKYSLSSRPEADQFVEILVTENRWYDLGTLLKAPQHELDHIKVTYHLYGVMRCLIELHACLHKRDILPTWQNIADALRIMGNIALANSISPPMCTGMMPGYSMNKPCTLNVITFYYNTCYIIILNAIVMYTFSYV